MIGIDNITFPFTARMKSAFANSAKTSPLNHPKKDVFVRTQHSTAPVSMARLKELYHSLWNEVISQNVENNPVLNDVKINKPKIKFYEADDKYFAVYRPLNNSIRVNLGYLKEEKYIIASYDDNGELTDVEWVGEKKFLRSSLRKFKKSNYNIKILKLNKDEEKIILECALAHEIRHCIQTHLILSSEGGYKIYKDEIREIIEQMKDEIKNAKQQGAKRPRHDIPLWENMYFLTYQPKCILPKNARLKLSLDKDDFRYYSIYNHFVSSSNRSKKQKGKFDTDKYLSDINEIDAHRYEYEYCLFNINKWKKTNAREEFLICLLGVLRNTFD